MTPPKPLQAPGRALSPEAVSLPSVQAYQAFCQENMPEFKLAEVRVNPRPKDLNAQQTNAIDLHFYSSESNNRCVARVYPAMHEMEMRFERNVGDKKTIQVAAKYFAEMKDVCSFIQQAAGLKTSPSCSEDSIDPRLKSAEQFETFRSYEQHCQRLLREAYGASPTVSGPLPSVNASRIALGNRSPKDGLYSFYYQNKNLDFFCAADVNTLEKGMVMYHGKLSEGLEMLRRRSLEADTSISKLGNVPDICSMTRALVSEQELPNPNCSDPPATPGGALGMTLGVIGSLLGSLGLLIFDLSYNWTGRRIVYPIASRVLPGFTARAIASPWLGGLKNGILGYFVVQGVDQTVKEWMVGNDYLNSVNERAAEAVYARQGLYDYGGWNAINPFAYLNKARRLPAWIAPHAMSWAVGQDNPQLVEALLKIDAENSAKATQFLDQTLPAMFGESQAYQNESLELLKSPIALSGEEQTIGRLLKTEDPQVIKSRFALNDAQLEHISKKILLKDIQEAASFLVYAATEQNNWAPMLFNSNGTLKAEKEQDAVHYYRPAPFPAGNAIEAAPASSALP